MPERQAAERYIAVNGITLCYFEWGRAGGDAPTVLLAHATGFHGRCWDKVVAALPEGQHVIAVDQRGHGRSEKVSPYDWAAFGADMTAFIAALGLQRIIGVGHSMGGHVVVQAAASQPEVFERLVLVDPVIIDPTRYQLMAAVRRATQGGEHPTARRNNEFASWQEMFDRLKGRDSFACWRADVLQDYCRHGVVPNPDGSNWILACPPAVEAAIYTGTMKHDIHELLGRIDIPVAVLRAPPRIDSESMDFLASPTWPELANQFVQGRDVFLPHLTHFIPMQEPALVAAFIEDHDAAAPSAS